MKNLLAQAGRSFLRAFGASLIVLAPGILSAPDLHNMYLLGVAALFASLAAGLKAIQVFVPQLSFASLLKQPYAAWLDSFSRAFLAALVVSLIGILTAPHLVGWQALVTAALVGAVAAGLRALEGFLTKGELPKPQSGLNSPSTPPATPPAA